MFGKVKPARAYLLSGAAALAVLAGGLGAWRSRTAGGGELPVRGRVLLDGEPVAGGLVVFLPDRARGNDSAVEPRGRIDRDGWYRLRTEGKAGGSPGWYKVAVIPPEPAKKRPGGAAPPTPWAADPRFRDGETSGLAVRVAEEGDPGAYDLHLMKPVGRR